MRSYLFFISLALLINNLSVAQTANNNNSFPSNNSANPAYLGSSTVGSPVHKLYVGASVKLFQSGNSGFSSPSLYLTNTSGGAKTYFINSGSTGLFRIVDGDASLERFVINAAGNIGIGTSAPVHKLDVDGSAHFGGSTTDNSMFVTSTGDIGIGMIPTANIAMQVRRNVNTTVGIRFENMNTGTEAFTTLQLGQDVNPTSTGKFLNIGYANTGLMPYGVYQPGGSFIVNNGVGGLNMAAYNPTGAPKMRFFTGNGVTDSYLRMIIDENGYTGIGTATPGYKLQVSQPAANTPAAVFEGSGGAGIVRIRPIGSGRALDIGFTGAGEDMFISAMNATTAFRIVGASSPLTLETDIAYPIKFRTANTDRVIIDGNGNMGVGTSTPAHKLDVNGTLKINDGTQGAGKVLTSNSDGVASWQTPSGGGGSSQWLNAATNIYYNDGKVGIGTSNFSDAYKLFVEGSVRARKVRVDQQIWPDYVFQTNYDLLPLKSLEEFIEKNKHLPEVPTAAVVEKEGIDIGDNQAVLLKKIEELTLYIIGLNNKVEKLSAENESIKKQLGVKVN